MTGKQPYSESFTDGFASIGDLGLKGIYLAG